MSRPVSVTLLSWGQTVHPAYRNVTNVDISQDLSLQQETTFSKALLAIDKEFGMATTVEGLDERLRAAWPDLLTHMEHEEATVFPALESQLSKAWPPSLRTWRAQLHTAGAQMVVSSHNRWLS